MLHLGESFLRSEEVLVIVEDIADLVQIVAVKLAVPDHARECLLRGHILLHTAPLAAAVLVHHRHDHVLERPAGEEAVVALEVKFQPAGVQPIHNAAALIGGDALVK